MDNNFQNMLDSIPNEAWEYWQHEKRHGKPPEFPDARIVIKIAQWRATEVMKQQEIEN